MNAYTDTPAGEIFSLEQKVKTPSPWQVVGENVVSFVQYLVIGTMVGYYIKKQGVEYGVLGIVCGSTIGLTISNVGLYFHQYNRDLSKTIRGNIGTLAGVMIGHSLGYHL